MSSAEVPFQDPRRKVGQIDPGVDAILNAAVQEPEEVMTSPHAPPVEGIDPGITAVLDQHLENVRMGDRAMVRALRVNAKVNPDMAGEIERLSLDLSVPEAMVEADIERARSLWQEHQWNTLRASGGNRTLMRAMMDPKFARIAMDDSENLSLLENIWRHRSAKKLEERQALLWDRVRSGEATDKDRAEIEDISRRMEELPANSDAGGFFESLVYGAVRMEAGMEQSIVESLTTGAALAGTALGLGQLGPQAAIPEELVSVPAMFGAGFFGQLAGSSARREGGAAYGQMIEMGVDHSRAKFWSGAVGVTNGLLETASAGVLTAPFRRAASRALTRKVAQQLLTRATTTGAAGRFAIEYAKGLGAEVATELAQEVSNVVGEELAIMEQRGVDPRELDLEGRAPMLDRLAEVTAETLRGMALLGLPGPALEASANLSRARAASQDQAWFENLGKAVDQSKTRPRSERTFRRFLEQVAGENGADRVYIDLGAFEARMEEAGLTEAHIRDLSPDAYKALREARETGTVEIPTADYVTTLGDFGRALIPDLRLQPDGVSGREAAPILQQADAEIEAVQQSIVEEAEVNDRIKVEADAVEARVVEQLQKAGQRPEVARAAARYYRHFVLRQSAERGMTPEQFQRELGLEFAPDSDIEGLDAEVLEQDTPEFREWFGESKAVDEAGKPLVVYHGRVDASGGLTEVEGGAMFFTDNPDTAAQYAETTTFRGKTKAPEGSQSVPVMLSLQNPLVVDLQGEHVGKVRTAKIREARKGGHDGVIFRDGEDTPQGADPFGSLPPNYGDVYVVFDPAKQVKSVNNRGTFDPASPNILMQPGEGASPFGRFMPDINTVFLSKDAATNPSTVFHEMSHYFMFALLDTVERGAASEQTVADVDTLLQWFGIEGEDAGARFANWSAMDIEAQRAHHESLARNFESYLFEGKAPTVGLERVFAKIRSWMLQVYRDVRDRLNAVYRSQFGVDLPGLTDEVRAVFDRMVASEDAVMLAEATRAMMPAFQTQEQFVAAGHSESEWARYQQAIEDAREEAVTELTAASLKQMQWLTNARSRALKDLQREHDAKRREVRAEVEAEVAGEDIYVATRLLQESKAEGKLNQEQVEGLLKGLDAKQREAAMAKLGAGRRGRKTMVSPSGASAEFLASALGYESGSALVRSLLAARPFKEEVEARTTKRMVQDHAELTTDDQVKEAVDRALHKQARARFLAAELRFLEGSQRPARVLLAAAKESARRILGGKPIRDIRPDRYSQAEARAARDARDAMKPAKDRKTGDPAAAVEAKRRQLLNNQLAKQAHKARQEVETIVRSFRDLNRSDAALARLGDPALLRAAQWVLSQYGLTTLPQTQKAADYLELVREYDPALFEVLEPDLREAQQQGKGLSDWKDLQLDQLRAIRETVDTLRFRARRDQQVDVDGKRVEVDAAVEELVEQLGELPAEVGGERGAISDSKRWGLRFLSSRANLTKAEHYLRHLDGGERGPFLRFIHDGVRHALDRYRADASTYVRRLVEDIADLRKRGHIPNEKIEAQELQYVFGDGRRTGMVELLGAMLHMGNESNRSKFLIAGRGQGFSWADWNEDGSPNFDRWDGFVQRMVDEGVLTVEHFDFLQRTWDLMEEILPQVQAAHREITGRFFKKVPHRAFEVQFPDGTRKTYSGGYVPAARDRDLLNVDRVEVTVEEMEAEFHRGLPKVSDGFTKSRVEGSTQRPLAMDVNMIASHIDETIRYSHVQPRVADVLRLLRRDELSGALRRLDRASIDGVILPYLQRAVKQSLYERGKDPTQDAFWKMIRRNTGIGIMFGNVVNTLQQLTGLSNAALYVPFRNLKHALYQHVRNGGLGEQIAQRSEFMDDRLNNQMMMLTADLRELLVDASPSARVQEWIGRRAYFMQAFMQNQVDVIVWWGAYEHSMEQNLSEADAIAAADSAVRLSQGSFNPEDVAPYEVNTPLARTWTQFTSYFNAVLNQVAFSNNRLKATALAFSLPMIAAQAIAMTLWQQWDDEDDDGHLDTLFNLIGYSQISGAFSMVPGYGPGLLGVIDQMVTDREFGSRVAASPAMVTLSRALIGFAQAGKAVVDDERDLSGRRVRDAMTAMVLLVPHAGIAAWAIRPASYLTDVAQGNVDPDGVVDLTLGVLSGRASPDSRK